ncbi:MAG: hypothetical protein EPN46_01280 [Candidimonas sp.]|nr:MAG: hypothetical protein EPN77_14165 [Candidimonas sp.]TAM24518.1 MAG: hypothetical protein EPN62_06540 [Candidimonas sp.]TAM80723.1 MAG: hypothetical protein EPN46_01280 [Candidimonas sp.]
MRQITVGAAKRLFFSLGVLTVLGGCAVYPAGYSSYGYSDSYGQPVYVQSMPAYVAPAPVYVAPAPVYIAPPVSLNFGFGWWGGGDRDDGWGGRHGRGWRR